MEGEILFQTYKILDIAVSLKLSTRISSRLCLCPEIGNTLRSSDDGAVKGEDSSTLEELSGLLAFVELPLDKLEFKRFFFWIQDAFLILFWVWHT